MNNDVAEELASIKQSIFYVLIGFNTTIQEDLHRLNLLRTLKERTYVMFYQKCGDTEDARKYSENEIIIQKAIKRLANNKSWFAACTFKQFVNREENKSRELISYKIVIYCSKI